MICPNCGREFTTASISLGETDYEGQHIEMKGYDCPCGAFIKLGVHQDGQSFIIHTDVYEIPVQDDTPEEENQREEVQMEEAPVEDVSKHAVTVPFIDRLRNVPAPKWEHRFSMPSMSGRLKIPEIGPMVARIPVRNPLTMTKYRCPKCNARFYTDNLVRTGNFGCSVIETYRCGKCGFYHQIEKDSGKSKSAFNRERK